MAAGVSSDSIKRQQVVYHDWEACHYDEKWSISFDQRCVDYVRGRFQRALPAWDRTPFDEVLEVGCGTGFFVLNLAQAGVVGRASCCDISAGMVDRCVANGRRIGVDVSGSVADAEDLPYADGTFDLVVGHAVLHHLPDLPAAFAEFRRVLRPGGHLVIAGEPTWWGHMIASQWKRATRLSVHALAALLGSERVLAAPAVAPEERAAAELEWAVDLHVFAPREVEALAVDAGFEEVRTATEELTANWFGWSTRTLEALLRPGLLPACYPVLAYRVWQRLFALDEFARAVVPKPLFYNCILSARAS